MNTREKLLEATVRLFAEVGSRGATTRRIAAAAGVNEVTLFRQFGTKENLLRQALHWASQRALVIRLPEDPLDPEAELTAWCREHLLGMHHARALLRTSMGEFEENPEVSASACEVPTRVARELHDYLLRLREKGLIGELENAPAAAALLMGALFSDAISRDIMPERYPYPLEAAASQYVRLFLRAMGQAE